MPCSVPAVVARSTFTVSAPAALSAAASACAVGSPPVTTLTERPSTALARPSTNSEPRPRSTPSDSQMISMFGVAVSRRTIPGSASTRSIACGLGLSRSSATRAAAGVCNEMSRPASPSGISAMPRLSASARAIRSSAVRMRASQLAAAEKPSSISSAIGIAPIGGGGWRVPQRPGRGEDDQRRERQAQQREPPRRARWRVFLRLDVEQEPGRRKFDAPGPRWDQPQQPPQHGQAEQAEQHQRAGEAERQAHHADLPRPDVRRCRATAPPRRCLRRCATCSASSNSFGCRSVRCDDEAPAELVGDRANFGAMTHERVLRSPRASFRRVRR